MSILNEVRKEITKKKYSYKAIITVDSDGRISSWNNSAEELFGWKKTEVLNSFIKDILNTEIIEGLNSTIKLKVNEEPNEFFLKLFDKYGISRFVLISILKLPAKNDKIANYKLECTDITNANYIINELRKQRDELSILAHRLQHDLRNSLSCIENSIYLIRGSCTSEFASFTKKTLDMVLTNINTIRILLEKSLRLADSGKIIDKKRISNLGKVIFETVNAVNPHFNYRIGQFPLFWADEEILFFVFKNIIENNLNHGSPTFISIFGEDNPDFYRIHIINDGNKIAEEIIDKIITNQTSGLGMIIVNKILKAHNWELEITSKKLETTFTIKIPKSDVFI